MGNNLQTTTTTIETIDLSINWVQALSICLVPLEAGNDEGRKIAKEQLLQMAKVADLYSEDVKAGPYTVYAIGGKGAKQYDNDEIDERTADSLCFRVFTSKSEADAYSYGIVDAGGFLLDEETYKAIENYEEQEEEIEDEGAY